MGKKEREKKARRLLAALNRDGQMLAAGGEISASSVSWGGAEAAADFSRVAPSNTATDSTKPARSVIVAGLGSEVKVCIPKGTSERRQWDYDEGKGGKYTCAECGFKPFRSWFLIEATDGDGNLCCEFDVEGRLYGRCYECCRGRGQDAGAKDIYENIVGTHNEDQLQKLFNKECNKRHNRRSDVKKRATAIEDQGVARTPRGNCRKIP